MAQRNVVSIDDRLREASNELDAVMDRLTAIVARTGDLEAPKLLAQWERQRVRVTLLWQQKCELIERGTTTAPVPQPGMEDGL